MATTPTQPGRITPKNPAKTGAPSTPTVNNVVEDELKKAAKPVGVATNATMGLGVGAVGQVINARNNRINRQNMQRFQSDLYRTGSAQIPQAKKRISTIEQLAIIAFAAVIDLIEFILDLFAVGLLANRIIDIVVAILFFMYALFKGLTITEHWKVYGSILGTIAGEFIPGLDIAPFFTLDAWYITHTLQAEARAKQAEMNVQAEQIITEYQTGQQLTELKSGPQTVNNNQDTPSANPTLRSVQTKNINYKNTNQGKIPSTSAGNTGTTGNEPGRFTKLPGGTSSQKPRF